MLKKVIALIALYVIDEGAQFAQATPVANSEIIIVNKINLYVMINNQILGLGQIYLVCLKIMHSTF